jgi:O-acetyl-ADP-ribose deacetylase (regulator of RNase III)
MTTPASAQTVAATFGQVTVSVSDGSFMVEPAAAVIVSANSHLRTASGGAHDVTRVAGPDYQSACAELLQDHPDGLPQGSAWLTGGGQGAEFTLTAGTRKVIQAITLRYLNGQPIRATPAIVYHAARSAFACADEAGIDRVATYLWAIRDGYGTARPAEMAAALVSAAADHGTEAVNLCQIAICEQGSDHSRYWLAVEALLQTRDLWHVHPHGWQGCRSEPPRAQASQLSRVSGSRIAQGTHAGS